MIDNQEEDSGLSNQLTQAIESWTTRAATSTSDHVLNLDQNMMLDAFHLLLANKNRFVTNEALCEQVGIDPKTEASRMRSCVFRITACLLLEPKIDARVQYRRGSGYCLTGIDD